MKPLSPKIIRWALVVVMMVWFGVFGLFPSAYPYVGVLHYGVWFLDTFAILAANDAVVLGIDPYRPNLLDYFNRPHVYSPWWLELHRLGLGRAQIYLVGWTLNLSFFAAALARLRPLSRGEALWYAAIVGAPPILLGINRANNDLLIFILLAPVVACLLDARRMVRLFAAVLIVIAAGLKFFPAAAGLVLLSSISVDAREVRARLVVVSLGLILVFANIAPDLPKVFAYLPKAEGLMTFAAGNLPKSLGLSPKVTQWAVLALAMLWVAWVWRSDWTKHWYIRPESQASWLSFVLGGVLLTGCFFTASNFGYRWVFGIWMAPLLWWLPRDPTAPIAVRRWARVTALLFIYIVWSDGFFSAAVRLGRSWITPETGEKIFVKFLAVQQPITWMFFAAVLVFLTHFTREGFRAILAREKV